MQSLRAEFSDCERRDDWFFEQDVNAWTALAYIGAAALLLVFVARGRLPRTVFALAVATALEGVGSVLYHGGSGDVAEFLHDVPLVAMLAFIAGWHAGRLFGRPDAGALMGFTVGAVAGSVGWAAAPGATNVAVATAGIVAVVAEVVAQVRGTRVIWGPPLVSLLLIASVFWAGGTPDSPLCDAGSLLQPHGVWHLLTAVLVVVWADKAMRSPT